MIEMLNYIFFFRAIPNQGRADVAAERERVRKDYVDLSHKLDKLVNDERHLKAYDTVSTFESVPFPIFCIKFFKNFLFQNYLFFSRNTIIQPSNWPKMLKLVNDVWKKHLIL